MTTNLLPVTSFSTYNANELTCTGWDIDFFEDYAILVYHSNWQGSRPGTTYKAFPPAEVMEAARREAMGEDHGHNPDLESAVDAWLSRSVIDDEWTLIRKGGIIR